jgi:hypothetical protein
MVRAFTRHANIPEKSFLRSALGEMAPEIQQQLQQAVNKALRGAT